MASAFNPPPPVSLTSKRQLGTLPWQQWLKLSPNITDEEWLDPKDYAGPILYPDANKPV